jgi:hypothetical protein
LVPKLRRRILFRLPPVERSSGPLLSRTSPISSPPNDTFPSFSAKIKFPAVASLPILF